MSNQKVLFSLMSLLVCQGILCNEVTARCRVGQTIIDPPRDAMIDYVDVLKLETELTGTTLRAVLHLSNVPATLLFNRHGVPDNIAEYSWLVMIDVDNNPNTGDQSITQIKGAEYALNAEHFKSGSTPVQLSIEEGVKVDTFKYNGNDKWSNLSGATLDVDHISNKLVLTGDIPGITSTSQILFWTYDFNPGGILEADFSSNASCSSTPTNRSHLESPHQGSFESGIGLIRGWICRANTVEVQIDGGERQRVAYGTTRKDTSEVCGDDNNGFGYTFNWNTLGTGNHTLRAFADNVEFANVTFNVTTLGVDYLQGISGEYPIANFPQTGKDITVRWSEPHQNFVIVDYR